ncbi:MAG: SDR family NAD(P)-dependent oxidoreductase [Promethearchaeota archaeon]
MSCSVVQDQRLKDRVIVISGASGGFGRAMALRFSREGAHLVLCDVNGEELEKTVKLAREVFQTGESPRQ